MSKAQRENLQHTLSRWWRDFICCCLGKNCCGGEFFAGKAGFFATQVGRSTWLHISVLHLCKGCFKSQSGMLTRMSFLLVLITGGTDRPRVPQQPSHYPSTYGSRTWCDELWNVQCFFVFFVFRKQYSFHSAVLCMQFFAVPIALVEESVIWYSSVCSVDLGQLFSNFLGFFAVTTEWI